MLYRQSCTQCGKEMKKRCKLELINESTLEVYLIEEDFTAKTHRKDLLFCVNFDTTKVELTYVPQLEKHSLTYRILYLALWLEIFVCSSSTLSHK